VGYQASDQFRLAFKAAFSSPKVESDRAKDLAFDLMVFEEALAGPMYNVLTAGNHSYVFTDSEGRFPGVVDHASFRRWAVSLARSYQDGVAKFEPTTPSEERDRSILSEKADALMKVIDAAEAEQR